MEFENAVFLSDIEEIVGYDLCCKIESEKNYKNNPSFVFLGRGFRCNTCIESNGYGVDQDSDEMSFFKYSRQ